MEGTKSVALIIDEISAFENKKIVNAKITDTRITMEEHGVLTFYVFLEGKGFHCGLGGYCIGVGYLGADDDFAADNGGGLVAMMNIMNVVGVEVWEKLKGKYCRVVRPEWGETVTTIGNLIDDKWFDVKKFFETYVKKEKNENGDRKEAL